MHTFGQRAWAGIRHSISLYAPKQVVTGSVLLFVGDNNIVQHSL